MVKISTSSIVFASVLVSATFAQAQIEELESSELLAREPIFGLLKKIPIVGGLFGRDEYELQELAAREPIFGLLKKIPFVGNLFGRELSEFSVRDVVEELEFAARDDPDLAELIARDPLFGLLKKIPVIGGLFGRDYDDITEFSVREFVEEIEFASRESPELAELVERSPIFGLLKKIPVIGGLFGRDDFDDLDARELGYGDLEELD